MTQINKDVEMFLSEIRKNLVCSTQQKNYIIGDFKNSIIDFIEENNITDINKVYEHFGNPKVIANQLIAELEPQKIKKAFKYRKIIILGVIIAILIFTIVIVCAAIDGHKNVDGYFVEEVKPLSSAAMISSLINI